jgi:hypothetical protein
MAAIPPRDKSRGLLAVRIMKTLRGGIVDGLESKSSILVLEG